MADSPEWSATIQGQMKPSDQVHARCKPCERKDFSLRERERDFSMPYQAFLQFYML